MQFFIRYFILAPIVTVAALAAVPLMLICFLTKNIISNNKADYDKLSDKQKTDLLDVNWKIQRMFNSLPEEWTEKNVQGDCYYCGL